MHRKTVTAAVVALVAMMGASAALASASDAASGATATTAAKKHKKKKKKKKRKKTPAAPATPAPGKPTPIDLNPCAGDDAFEPDDAAEQAFSLPYPGTWETNHDRFLCPNDVDYFQVTVPADGYFAISVLAFEAVDPTITIYGDDAPVVVDNGGYGARENTAINNSDASAPVTRWIAISANPGDSGPYYLKGYAT